MLGWSESHIGWHRFGIRIDLQCSCLLERERLSASITGHQKEHQSHAQKWTADRKARRWIWTSIAYFAQDTWTNPGTYHNSRSDHHRVWLSYWNGLCDSGLHLWAFVPSKQLKLSTFLLCCQIVNNCTAIMASRGALGPFGLSWWDQKSSTLLSGESRECGHFATMHTDSKLLGAVPDDQRLKVSWAVINTYILLSHILHAYGISASFPYLASPRIMYIIVPDAHGVVKYPKEEKR